MIDPKLLADIAFENATKHRASLLVALVAAMESDDNDAIAQATDEIASSAEEVIMSAWVMIEALTAKGNKAARVAHICLAVSTGETTWDDVEAAMNAVEGSE